MVVFPGPGGPNERDGLSRFHLESEILDDGAAAGVGELDVAQAHVSVECANGHGTWRFTDFRRRVNDLENAFRAGKGSLDGVVQVGQLTQRRGEVLSVVDERGNRAYAHQALQREPPSQAGHHDDEEAAQDSRERHEQQGI